MDPRWLICAGCRDALGRIDAVFCAGCAAAHHDHCFVGRGGCAIPGCEERTVVRPVRIRPRAAAGRLVSVTLAVVGLALAAVGVAAQRQADVERDALGDRERALAEERRRAAAELLFLRFGEEDARPEPARVDALWAELVRLAGEPRELASEAPALAAAEREVEALFQEIRRLAEAKQVEELVVAFTRLREVMNAAEEHADPATRKRWRRRLQCGGEIHLGVELQLFISEGNQALRSMADAIRRDDFGCVEVGWRATRAVCAAMRAEGREVFRRNADALEVRARALFDRSRLLRRLSDPALVPTEVTLSPLEPARCTIGGASLRVGEWVGRPGPTTVQVVAIAGDGVTLRCGDRERVVRLAGACAGADVDRGGGRP